MIARISGVRLYLTSLRGVDKAKAFQEALTSAGIQYIEMHYGNAQQLPQVLEALNTWSFGKNPRKAESLDFPFVTWDEFHDDFERVVEIAQTPAELRKLLENKSRVQFLQE